MTIRRIFLVETHRWLAMLSASRPVVGIRMGIPAEILLAKLYLNQRYTRYFPVPPRHHFDQAESRAHVAAFSLGNS
jgi:hypothetical protein